MASRDDHPTTWRQPLPEAAGERAHGRVQTYLTRVFEASEDENKRVILAYAASGPPRRRVLDLGCYNGVFTADLGRAARAEVIAGVEWLPAYAAQAQSRGVQVTVGDVNDPLPYGDACFDLVHANQVIEHLRATDRFLREARRVCAPDGRVVLSTNNLAAWHNILSLALGWQPFPSHVSDEVHVGNPVDPRRSRRHADVGQTHLRVFTVRALRELAAVHGLQVERVLMNGYYPLAPRIARRLARVDGRHAAFMVLVLCPAAVPA